MTTTGWPLSRIPTSQAVPLLSGALSQAVPGSLGRIAGIAVPPGINGGAAIVQIAQAARNPLALAGLAGQAARAFLTNRALARIRPSSNGIPGRALALAPVAFSAPPRYRAIAVVDDESVTTADGQILLTVIPYQAQVTIKEEHRDELCITDHPVEAGASITDHAFKRPAELSITAGWSNSPSPLTYGRVAFAGTAISQPVAPLAAGSDFIRQMYDALLKLQASRQPFRVYTGKRSYSNMLFQQLQVVTDPENENALILNARLREIIIATVQVTTIPQNKVQNNGGGGVGPTSGTSVVANTGAQKPRVDLKTINKNGVCRSFGKVVDLANAPVKPLPFFQK